MSPSIPLFILLVYFLPTIIGFVKGKSDRALILLLNLFTGWTVIGWIACLIWASSDTIK